MKLALISFDGLDPRVIYDNKNDLSTFYSFMNNAVHGKWRTPGHTIPSYIATLTGLPYHKTNFYWDVETDGFARHRQINRDYLWEIVNSSMTLLNIPVLYPPEDIEDAMICGILAPDEVSKNNIARPKEVQELLNSINYVPSINTDATYDRLKEGMEGYCIDVMDKRLEAAKLLINKYNSDLFYGVWTMPDRWFHQCRMHKLEYKNMYLKCDEILNELLENVIPDDIPVVIFSDHGFAHYSSDGEGVNKGHMYQGWYGIHHPNLPSFRDDSANIADLFPSVVNYLGAEVPEYSKGRILFHREDQDNQVKDRLRDLGYME